VGRGTGEKETSTPNATAVKWGMVRGVRGTIAEGRGAVTEGHNQANGSEGQRLPRYSVHWEKWEVLIKQI